MRRSTVVYEGRPRPECGYRVWHGWREPAGHVASFTGEARLRKTLRSALRRARKYERMGKHTRITRVETES